MVLESPYSYSYPTHKTGTAQDLMSVITRAYEIHLARSRTSLPAKSNWQRALIEPPFILFGLFASGLLSLLPAQWVLAGHAKLFETLASPHRYAFNAADPVLERARALSETVAAQAGQAPALLSLVSHAPVLGDLAHLNFSLVRHAMLALRAVRDRACRPRLLVAVDFFALDAIPLWQEGIYEGFMGHYHLGFDRMALSRGALARGLLAHAAWQRTPYRLLRSLEQGKEIGLVLAGGVPSTTRILYAAREWLSELRRRSPLRRRPAEVLQRLRAEAEFARFARVVPVGAKLSANAWRMAEAWAMASLAGVFGESQSAGQSGAEAGVLTEEARACFTRCLSAFGFSKLESEEAIEELPEELARETPYRARFFRVLASRVLKSGRPIVFIPIAHRLKPHLRIDVHEAWAWRGYSKGKVRAILPGGNAWEGSPEAFAELFGRANFA
jgi:hypothetical protein